MSHTSFFITLDKPIYIGANKYSYKDQMVYKDESKNKKVCKNKKEFYDDICNNEIAHMYVEGQKRNKMDYAIRDGMYMFVRIKSSDFVYIGNINNVEILRENSEFSPAFYKVSIDTSNHKVKEIIKPKDKTLSGASKIAAFQHLDLPMPVSFNMNCGIFDHDQGYNSKTHPQKQYKKRNHILNDLENQINMCTKDIHPNIHVLFQMYSNICRSGK